jgi:hypothetical protein
MGIQPRLNIGKLIEDTGAEFDEGRAFARPAKMLHSRPPQSRQLGKMLFVDQLQVSHDAIAPSASMGETERPSGYPLKKKNGRTGDHLIFRSRPSVRVRYRLRVNTSEGVT